MYVSYLHILNQILKLYVTIVVQCTDCTAHRSNIKGQRIWQLDNLKHALLHACIIQLIITISLTLTKSLKHVAGQQKICPLYMYGQKWTLFLPLIFYLIFFFYKSADFVTKRAETLTCSLLEQIIPSLISYKWS